MRQGARLDLRIDQELREAIERIAQEKDRSVAWVVRDALRRYIQQEHPQVPG
jgi:predicted transcriptional regulator